MNIANRIPAGVATILIVAFCAIVVEAMYRYHLNRIVTEDITASFHPSGRPTFGAIGVAPWVFDREQGFVMEQRPWRVAQIADAAFAGCVTAGHADRYGNLDHAPDNYADADLRLMIVGSSYSMVPDENGRLVNEVLRDRLSTRFGRKVHILNFSRDSTGVLNHIDIARYNIDKLKPDAVIMLVNVTQFIYRRHWRTVLPEDNGFRRLYFALDPVEQPTDPSRAIPQPQIINDRITDEWCERLTNALAHGDTDSARNDPLVKALVERRDQLQNHTVLPRVTVNFWRIDTSFVFNLLRYGDPFHEMILFAEQPVYTPLLLDRYTDDADFNAAVAHLKETGIPILPVHIPTFVEMQNYPDGGYDFASNGVPPRQGASLRASLEQALDQKMVELYRDYPAELTNDPVKLVVSATNSHPSALGVRAMAEALERVLLRDPRLARQLSRIN